MTLRSVNILVGILAFIAGVITRLSTVWIGNWSALLFLVLILAVFGWVFAKTRFSSARYTPQTRRVQMTAIWAIVGFNLAVFAEGFE